MRRLRVSLSVLVTVLLLELVTIATLSRWYAPSTSPPSAGSCSTPPQGKIHVLLLSSWRSGSSFLGQVFNQHPSVFYLMEPAWHVWKTLHMSGAQEVRMAVRDLLHQVLKCDLSVMDSYLPRQSKASKLFMWSHSRALCSPPLCSLTPPGAFSNQPQCEKRCVNGSLALAADACRNYSHVVLKTVRIFELESLYPLLRDPTLDLRIIHLVRDPRAVWRSRRSLGYDLVRDNGLVLQHSQVKGLEADYRVMEAICQSHVRIYQTLLLDPPDFLRGRYKMVRYEDVVDDPLGQVNAVYKFTGLNMTHQLHRWIYHTTHLSGSAKDPFETSSRNAKAVSRAWRTKLAHQQVRQVQQLCKGAMSLLGYRAVDSDKEQRQLDRDVLLPRELNQLSLESPRFSWLPSKTDKPFSEG
ncbi:hypothetical protein ACEWY4_017704 [Coilia grayii]|uniref:Sulfotransferase n=1 Tax=Coilia grayii TaxID=363190 RepID=A0ABD1JHJ6_9TELE